MPYRVQGDTVYVQRNGRWVVLKKHKNAGQARAHLRALQLNVPEAHKGKR